MIGITVAIYYLKKAASGTLSETSSKKIKRSLMTISTMLAIHLCSLFLGILLIVVVNEYEDKQSIEFLNLVYCGLGMTFSFMIFLQYLLYPLAFILPNRDCRRYIFDLVSFKLGSS